MLLDYSRQDGKTAGLGLAWGWVAVVSLLLEVDEMLEWLSV